LSVTAGAAQVTWRGATCRAIFLRRGVKPGWVRKAQQPLKQAGYAKKSVTSGVLRSLPLGWWAHDRICSITFDGVEKAGVRNIQLSILQAKELRKTDLAAGRLRKVEDRVHHD
jgi:prolyl-tRNA synthetase